MKAVTGTDWDDLLTETISYSGGDKFGARFTGEGFFLIRGTVPPEESMEQAREEWVKLLYLFHLYEEYESHISEIGNIIGAYDISSSYFDRWWSLKAVEENRNIDTAFDLKDKVKSLIKPSKNNHLKQWLSEIGANKTINGSTQTPKPTRFLWVSLRSLYHKNLSGLGAGEPGVKGSYAKFCNLCTR